MAEADDRIVVDASARTALGTVTVVHRSWAAPIDVEASPPLHHLELALLPRSNAARGCFPARWGPHRYERIGELFLLPAGEPVHARSECREQNSIICVFRPQAIADWFEDAIDWSHGRLCAALDITRPEIRALLFRLGEEARAPGFAGDAMLELLSAQLGLELARHLRGVEDGPAAGGLAPWRLRRIDERLAEVGAAPTLAELAAGCGLSVRQLARGYRASRGASIGAHIAAVRIDHAKRLLAGDHGAKAIAHRLGFGSPSTFATAFRRATGQTPRDYRQRLMAGTQRLATMA